MLLCQFYMLVYWFYNKNVRHILKYRRVNQNHYIGGKTDNTMTKLKKKKKKKSMVDKTLHRKLKIEQLEPR